MEPETKWGQQIILNRMYKKQKKDSSYLRAECPQIEEVLEEALITQVQIHRAGKIMALSQMYILRVKKDHQIGELNTLAELAASHL